MSRAPMPRSPLLRRWAVGLGLALALATAVTAGSPPRVVRQVTAKLLADGTTLVQVSTDEQLAPGGWRVARLDGEPPRVLVVLTDTASSALLQAVPVNDPNLRQIRIGLHAERVPPELHVVLDLAAEDVVVLAEHHQGPDLLLRLGRQIPAAAAGPPSLSLQPSRLRWSEGEVANMPAATATLPPSPTASPTPLPTATPLTPPQQSPCLRGEPGTTILFRRADVHGASADTSPAVITEIVLSHRDDGSTLLRVSADRPYGDTDIKYRRDWQERSVYELVLAASAADVPPELEVVGGCLRMISISGEEGATPPSTTLRLHLVSPEVEVAQVAGLGQHAVVLITPR